MTTLYVPLPQGSYVHTSPYGYRTDPLGRVIGQSFHGGIDIAGVKQPLYAMTTGTVYVPSFEPNGAGNNIWITDDGGTLTKVFHMDSIAVRSGQRVIGGETVVGVMGTTGASTGVHAHLEVWLGGTTRVDPMPYYKDAEANGRYPNSNTQPQDDDVTVEELQQELANQDARTKAYIDAKVFELFKGLEVVRDDLGRFIDERTDEIRDKA